MKLVLLSVATATAMAVPASAQDAAPAAAQEAVAVPEAAIATVESAVATRAPVSVAAPACELHVFPTLEGQAMTTTMLSSFGIVGAIADAAQNKDRNISEAEYLKEALGPRLQIEALKSVNLPASLKIPASQIIYETPIADRKISTKATGRLSSSTAPCYAELNNRFIFKDFRGGKAKAKLVKGRGGNGLSFFPPKTTDETEVAEKELREVFAKNFTEFANGVK
jgi:hypothetical protein